MSENLTAEQPEMTDMEALVFALSQIGKEAQRRGARITELEAELALARQDAIRLNALIVESSALADARVAELESDMERLKATKARLRNGLDALEAFGHKLLTKNRAQRKEAREMQADRDHWKSLYDALLAGATAQRIATLMDEADKARVEIDRLKTEIHEWEESDAATVALSPIFTVRIAKLEKERDAARLTAEAFCRGQDAAIAERDAAIDRIELWNGRYIAAIVERDEAQVSLVNFRMDELEPVMDERDGLRRAIEAMVTRMEEMEPILNGVVSFAMVHGLPYSGPSWKDPMEQMKHALAAAPSPVKEKTPEEENGENSDHIVRSNEKVAL